MSSLHTALNVYASDRFWTIAPVIAPFPNTLSIVSKLMSSKRTIFLFLFSLHHIHPTSTLHRPSSQLLLQLSFVNCETIYPTITTTTFLLFSFHYHHISIAFLFQFHQSRRCVVIKVEWRVVVGTMWGRCGGGKIKIKKIVLWEDMNLLSMNSFYEKQGQ